MRITKDSVGKNVWLVATGNNRVNSLNEAKEATITKMARVKGEFKFVDSNHPKSFSVVDYSDSVIKQDDNAGYDVYSSLGEFKNTVKASKVRDYLRDEYSEISIETLLKVGAVLNLKLTN
jgi:hypothetical protein